MILWNIRLKLWRFVSVIVYWKIPLSYCTTIIGEANTIDEVRRMKQYKAIDIEPNLCSSIINESHGIHVVAAILAL